MESEFFARKKSKNYIYNCFLFFQMTALRDRALAKEGVASSEGKSTKSKVSMSRELTVQKQYSYYARYL